MLIKSNLPLLKKNFISIEDGDAWLENKPENKAENLTGKLAPLSKHTFCRMGQIKESGRINAK